MVSCVACKKPVPDNNLLWTSNGAAINLQSSISVTPIETYLSNPSLADDFASTIQGAFNGGFVEDSVTSQLSYIQAYENGYATVDNIFPALVSYGVSPDGNLTSFPTSIIYCPIGTGISAGVISDAPGFEYGAISTYSNALGGSTGFSTPHEFRIQMHRFSNGVFEPTPFVDVDMAEIATFAFGGIKYYNASLSYNGIAGVSSDGKYVVLTYAVGLDRAAIIMSQVLIVCRVNAEMGTLEVVATITTPATFLPNFQVNPNLSLPYNSFPQTSRMWKTGPTTYTLVVAYNSWVLLDPLGKTSQVTVYVVDVDAGTIEQRSTDFVPQYIQGMDVNEERNQVYANLNGVTTGPSARTIDNRPYVNSAVDKDSEFRVWDITSTNELRYVGGLDTGMDGVQVHWITGTNMIALTSSPVVFVDVFATGTSSTSSVARRWLPGVVQIYKRRGSKKFSLESSSPTAALPFAIASKNGLLAVGGQGTYRKLGIPGFTQREGGLDDLQMFVLD